MDDFFIGTRKECEDYIAKIDTMLGYPNAETKTLTYAKPLPHLSKRGMFFIPIKSVYAHSLKRYADISEIDAVSTEKELARVTVADLEREGAFLSQK